MRKGKGHAIGSRYDAHVLREPDRKASASRASIHLALQYAAGASAAVAAGAAVAAAVAATAAAALYCCHLLVRICICFSSTKNVLVLPQGKLPSDCRNADADFSLLKEPRRDFFSFVFVESLIFFFLVFEQKLYNF